MFNTSKFLSYLLPIYIVACSALFGEEGVSKDIPSQTVKEETESVKKTSSSADKDEPSATTEEAEVKTEQKKGEPPKEEPPKEGNFSLPVSQQPAALFGFGGNIIEKNEIQWYMFADDFIGKNKVITDVIPGILFGVTDDLSLFFTFPFTPNMRDGYAESNGLEDFFIQLEYSFYNNSTKTYVDQATIVTNITAPTGSAHINPPTGFGTPSLFLGGTYYRTTVDWVLFTAEGVVLTPCGCRNKPGDQFLYQFGIGRNLPSCKGWIYNLMLEIDGQYTKKYRVHGIIDDNSGGNVLYATPSIWISSKEVIFQFGVSLPLYQNLYGKQRKIDYVFNIDFAWSFY